jgi:hypothetical protein
MAHGLPRRLGARPHQNQDTVGLGMAGILDHGVAATHPVGQRRHHLLDHPRRPGIERVHRLPSLEVHVRILGSAADERMVR